MVERDLESRIIQKLNSIGLSEYQIVSSWQVVDDGEVRNTEDKDSSVIIGVATGIRQYDTPQIPTALIGSSIVMSVKTDMDATGKLMLTLAEKVMNLLQSWQDDLDIVINDCGTQNFSIVGFKIDGGTNPDKNDQTKTNTVSWSFTFQGTII